MLHRRLIYTCIKVLRIFYILINKYIKVSKLLKLFHIFTNNSYLKLVNGNTFGSDTVIVAAFLKEKTLVMDLLKSNRIVCSSGYGKFKDAQLRFSNFPANTVDDVLFLEKVLSS